MSNNQRIQRKGKGSKGSNSARFKSSLISVPKPVDIPSLKMETVGRMDSTQVQIQNLKHSVSINADTMDSSTPWSRKSHQPSPLSESASCTSQTKSDPLLNPPPSLSCRNDQNEISK